MRTMQALAAVTVIVVSLGMPASAHRVDEYLQATLISLDSNQDNDQVEAFLRLTPGIAVSSQVLARIDTDGDGIISENEKRTYAERVLADLSLTVDGHRLTPRLVSMDFPEVEQMKEGLGEIRIAFTAALPAGGPKRTLVFENHHQSQIAAYLVNCLTPRDPNICVIAQNRNEDQSFYQLDYAQAFTSRTALPQVVARRARMERMASRSRASPVRSGRIPFSPVRKWRGQKPPTVILKSWCRNVSITCLRILREQTDDLEPV